MMLNTTIHLVVRYTAHSNFLDFSLIDNPSLYNQCLVTVTLDQQFHDNDVFP